MHHKNMYLDTNVTYWVPESMFNNGVINVVNQCMQLRREFIWPPEKKRPRRDLSSGEVRDYHGLSMKEEKLARKVGPYHVCLILKNE